LTPNGKVDRSRLPAAESQRQLSGVPLAPSTETQGRIAQVWRDALHVKTVGLRDNFFDLGGHSLLLVEVHDRLRKLFSRDFSLVRMFEYPTVEALAAYLDEQTDPASAGTKGRASAKLAGRERLHARLERGRGVRQ
jgi:acyl carrier protein